MGLSNYLPSSRIAQPGVCTSSTRPATPFEGQVIYETDTNRVLVYDASAWVMIADTDQPPGLQLIKTQTISSAATSHLISDAFSADYDSYRIVGVGLECASVQGLNWQMGTTATGYYYSQVYADVSTVQATGGSNTTSWGLATLTADPVTSFVADVHYPNKTAVTTYTAQGSDARTSGGYAHRSNSGFLNNSTSYTSFTILAGANIEAGTIRVYGYRN